MARLEMLRPRRSALAILFLLAILLFVWPATSEQPPHAVRPNGFKSLVDIYVPSSIHTLLSRDTDDPYYCDEDKPCYNGACCGKGNYCGYGPDYCGDGCISNCDAHAECGKYAKEPGTKCPLNVCCSQFGFCGTTELFCDSNCQSNCGQPSVPAGGSSTPVRDKVIVYYEAWSARRKCKGFQPWNIPTSGVTHVNFAFAYIDPSSFAITTMDGKTPESLFQDTTALKSMKSGLDVSLEVFVSIGGWTFSDNGTDTQPVFSNIASSAENRQKFADEVVKFMTRYGFDGVDLDWEYPGAPDRGGRTEDTANYIELIRTLRSTFNRSPRGGYGLTFTIPSSYWYLRWFDVPNMIKAGADWVNLMSYDLHGVWDKHNPIGNIVQGHTNLTEIKQSVDLLWRNDVPPGKVVLGTGFYGRSFTLSDSKCSTPGCEFSGAANPGDCTGAGGILGFFEIQEILANNNDIEKVHDEDAAVNYFKFDNDQWVSYDDATTFDQKVKWADSVGLGGLMAWSIDMDDEQFTALSGLIGKPAGQGLNKSLALKEVQTASWSSDNGQDCYATECGDTCPPDWAIMTSYRSNCGGHKYRKFCCPRDRMPRDCTWRGGESGGPGRACHGQCHNGELTLLFDGWGSQRCASGRQTFCCTADRYKELLEGCQLGDCGGSCDKFTGTYEVAKQYDFGACWNHAIHGYKRPWCCKQNMACHWVGKGSCDQNNCDGHNDIQLSLSGYGDSSTLCGVAGRKKSLCCNAPDSVDPFTPVPLDEIFPEVPPSTYPSRWDLQYLGGGIDPYGNGELDGNNNLKDPNLGPFGFVLISGPEDVVASFSKRDDSHMEFVDCPSINSTSRQKTRIFCNNDGPDSNCADVMENGLDGTVVRMPDHCGPGQYIVAHSIKRSEDQSLPRHLANRKPSTHEVQDLEFSYDFGLMKRSDEKVYLRIDYSNMPGYWQVMVDSPGEKRKRSIRPHEIRQRDLLDKRFFSSDSASWGHQLDKVDDGVNYYTDFSQPAQEVIFNEKIEGCSEDSYLEVNSAGQCNVEAQFGFSMVGTLQPFSIDQAYGFVDLKYDLDATVEVSGHIGIDTEYKTKPAHVVPNRAVEFTHPGIVSFKPSFDLNIGIAAQKASFSGDFKAHFRSSTDPAINRGFVRETFPLTAGGTRGGLKSYATEKAFEGHMNTNDGEVQLSMIPNFDMAVTIDHTLSGSLSKREGSDLMRREEHHFDRRDSIIGDVGHSIAYIANFRGPNKLVWNKGGVELQVDSLYNSLISYGDNSLGSWKGSESTGRAIGGQPGGIQLHRQIPNEDSNAPAFHNKITPYTIFKADVLTCTTLEDGTPSCRADLCADEVMDCSFEPASNQRGSGGVNGKIKRSSHLAHHKRHAHGGRVHSKHGLDLDAAFGELRIDDKIEPEHKFRGGPSVEALTKRDPTSSTGGARQFNNGRCLNRDTGNTLGVSYNSLPYPVVTDWTVDDQRYDNSYDATDVIECTDGSVSGHSVPNFRYYVTEHIIELQTMQLFFNAIAANQLADGSRSGKPQIYCDFIRKLNTDMLSNPPPSPGSTTNSNRPMIRITQTHGWDENWQPFVHLERGINAHKKNFWSYQDPVERGKLAIINSSPTQYGDGLVNIRTCINVFNYMNFPEVHDKWTSIANSIRSELQRANTAWVSGGGTQTGIVAYWDAWIRSHMARVTRDGRAFAARSINDMRQNWSNYPASQLKIEVLLSLQRLQSQLGDITIDVNGLD